MGAIFNYIQEMMPYMLIAIPIYLVVRYYIHIKSGKDTKSTNWHREIALFLFVIFCIGLASQTIIPKFELGMDGKISIARDRVHNTNLIPLRVLYETYYEVFKFGYIDYFIINFLGNVIMFMPIGFCIPLLWNVSKKKVIVIGAGISLFIESIQLFLRRGTDIDDLILNTVGVGLGLVVYILVSKKCGSFTSKFKSESIKK